MSGPSSDAPQGPLLTDPGCVKTCTSQECAELFSLSSSLSSGRKHFWFLNLRNREGVSARRLNVRVFTRPRPQADIGYGPLECASLSRYYAFLTLGGDNEAARVHQTCQWRGSRVAVHGARAAGRWY